MAADVEWRFANECACIIESLRFGSDDSAGVSPVVAIDVQISKSKVILKLTEQFPTLTLRLKYRCDESEMT